MTQKDWMVASLLALNRPIEKELDNQKIVDKSLDNEVEKLTVQEEEGKVVEALPTGDSSNVIMPASGPKTDVESVPEAPTINLEK